MNKRRATKKRWIVHRKFEPNRLSTDIMVQAYAQIIPQHVRVVRLGVSQAETPGDRSQKPPQGPRKGKVSPQHSSNDHPPKRSLVIDSITKKEVV